MDSYFFAFFWGICILLSLIGWGAVVNRILFPKHRADWGQLAAWGVAFSIVVGGVLNVTWTISRTVILIYLGLGLIYWIFDFYQTRNSIIDSISKYRQICDKDKIVFLLSTIVIFMIGVQYAGSIYADDFNNHDDYHAYFVFPNKMLQMGSMGADPFSERRLMSSLGGQSFLDTFTVSLLSERSLNIIDQGCGTIIISWLIIGWFIELKTPIKTSLISLITLLCIVIAIPDVNITSVLIASALFLCLFRTINWSKLKSNSFIAKGTIIALLAAGICATKSTMIPVCVILLTLSYCFYLIKVENKKIAIYDILWVMSLSFLFLLPWMISMYQSSGTLLYPILGKGYHGYFISRSSDLTLLKSVKLIRGAAISFSFLACYLLSFIIWRQYRYNLINRESPLSLLISVWIGAILVALSTGSHRFSASFVVSAIIALMIIALDSQRKATEYKDYKFQTSMIISFLMGLLIAKFGSPAMYVELENIGKIKSGLNPLPLVTKEEVNSYLNMQQSIPEGETVLTRLEKPFVLDFSRNQVFIADYPGAASLPPGMPFFKGGEALADYLTSKSIKYVAYSYANEAGFQKQIYKDRLKPEINIWMRTQAQHTFDFQDNLKELGETRTIIYDDGEKFVLNLLPNG
ncbi:MAG: hypothetical protein RIB93_25180 [Coleofasciculus sp. D1-CHI-01]|uniref:hypothetical protein n=1 Tax=Coleofasciculus sp. D1-CHI-01 TaxID=3068482 RepID=UPI0032F47322